MFAQKVAIVALSAMTVVSAGNSTFSITPSEVTLSTRAAWCTSEINVCGQVCDATTNSCDPATLDFDCVCSDGTTPDLNKYANSLPFYICEQAFTDCISANVGSATGQANCTTSIKDTCGTENATSASTTTTSSSASSTATTTAASSHASGTAATTSSSHAGSMPTAVQQLGNGAIAVAALLAYAL